MTALCSMVRPQGHHDQNLVPVSWIPAGTFLFHFVVKEGAGSVIIFTHYLNALALQASARGMNCTTQTTALFIFNRGRDHKQAQPHPQECASYFLRPQDIPMATKSWPSVRYSVVSLDIYTSVGSANWFFKQTNAVGLFSLLIPRFNVHGHGKTPLRDE